MQDHTFELMRSTGIRSLILTSLAVILLLSCNLPAYAQGDQNEIMPARGFHPVHSYSIGDIETINTTSGNLMLDIPLASLPAGRGGHPGFQLQLRYNSKIWDGEADVAPDPNHPTNNVNVVWLTLSNEGGWRYNIPKRFHWFLDNRNSHGTIYPPSDPRNTNIWKFKLAFPDGSVREMRPYGFNDGWGDGYFQVQPAAGMSYYSIDGSFLRLDIQASGAWTLNFPDGRRVVNQSDGKQRDYDRLNNYIEAQLVSNWNNTGHNADVITDQLGRSLVVEYGTNEDYIHAFGFNGTEIITTVKWTNTYVVKVYRAGNHFQFDTNLNRTIKVVNEIQLPSQLGTGLKYTFGYNGNTAPGGGTSVGWGELNSITLPSGANSVYQYERDNQSGTLLQADWVLENAPSRKDLNYNIEYDGATVAAPTETWIYSLGDGFAGVTNPEGGTNREWFSPSPNRGRVYKIQKPDGTVVERIWKENRPFLPAGVFISSAYVVNPFVEDEFTSIPDATGALVLTAARHFSYDKNGNVTQVKEYDWFAYSSVARDAQGKPTGIPAGAPLKRVTTNAYNSDTPDSTNTTTNDPDSYDKSTAPRLLNLLKSSEVSNGSQTLSRNEFTYDNVLTTGNMTESRSWDSTKGAYTNPLVPGNSIAISHQYDGFGNCTFTTNARGFITKRVYGTIGSFTDLYPTQQITAFGNVLQRTQNTDYDFTTGLVIRTTDVDNNIQNETDYDVFGRVTESRIAANVAAAKTVTKTEYSAIDRRVITRSDLSAANDGKIVKIQHFDQLGRVRLTRELEDAAGQSVTDETTGIKVQTRYYVNNPCAPTFLSTCLTANAAVLARYQAVSNPYRATTSALAGSEQTMGWTRTRNDVGGRTVETQTFAGAALPGPWAANASSTGSTTFAYDGVFTMITDQAGKVRRSMIDALGRLIRVDEPAPDSTNLGTTSAPVQPTNYDYDAKGNLVTVTQGQQTRIFGFSSLSRMTSSKNPETSNSSDVPIATTFAYDANGNLTQRTDARGVVTTYVYDALDRMTSRSYSDTTPAVTYGYDAGTSYVKGRLTSVTSSVSSYTFDSYDAIGNVLTATQTTDGVAYATTYAYNRAGAFTSQTYPSGRTVVSEYDSAGRLAGLKPQGSSSYYAGAGSTDSNRISYAPHGVVGTMRLGNGLWEHANFNSRLQTTEIGLGSSSANSTVLQLSYGYGTSNNNGNVQSQTITVPAIGSVTGYTASQTYTYDELNRLATAQEGAAWVQNFDYDRYGNRSLVAGTTFPSPLNAENNPVIKTINNRINAATAGQTSVTYDNAGNLTTDIAAHPLTYDAENRQVKYNGGGGVAGGVTFSYDGDGRRVKKVTPTLTTTWVYNIDGRLIAEYTSGTASGAGTRYMTPDRLGSPRVITDTNQVVKGRHDYAPFGEEIPLVGGRSTDQKYGTAAVDGMRQRFDGKERDTESGLDYFLARYYSSAQGRFTSVDPDNAGADAENPQSWNGYSFTLNNPITNSDPDGLKVRICGTDGQCTDKDTDLTDEEFNRYFRDNKNIKITREENGGRIFENGVQIGTWTRMSFDDLNDLANGMIFGNGRTAGLTSRLVPVQKVVTYGAIIDVGLIAGVTIGIEMAGSRLAAGACFVAGTPVHTDHGVVAIEEIKAGDQVLSFNEVTNQTEYKTVAQTYVRESEIVLSITFAGEAEPVGATPNHPFYTRIHKARDSLDGEWIPAQDLRAGDEVLLATGGWARVLHIQAQHGNVSVYNFEVAGNHDYFVGQSGLLVHNDCWMEIGKAAKKLANDLVKVAKQAQRGTGPKSGEGGNPFMQAARELRELLAKNDKNWMPEFKELVKKEIDELIKKGQNINHPYK